MVKTLLGDGQTVKQCFNAHATVGKGSPRPLSLHACAICHRSTGQGQKFGAAKRSRPFIDGQKS